jgi:hypothetical protein
VEYIYSNGLYHLPWLWSIIEVIKQTSHLGKVLVGLFKFYPSPDSVPSNCDTCNNQIMNAIIKYNRTLKIEPFDQLYCECAEEWKEVLNGSNDFYKNLMNFVQAATGELSGCPTKSFQHASSHQAL